MKVNMKRMRVSSRGAWPFLLIAGVLGLAGCSDGLNNADDSIAPPGVTNETEAMQYLAGSDEFATNTESTFSDDAMATDEYNVARYIVDGPPIIPVQWGRFVDQVTKTVTVNVEDGDSSAIAQVDRDIVGTFRILAKHDTSDTTTFLVEKPFTDHSTRNIMFKRVGRDGRRFWLNWAPMATSMVVGGTVTPPVGQELKVTAVDFVTPAGNTITVTDPLQTFFRYPWRHMSENRAVDDVPDLTYGQQFTVRATIVSASADADLAALRYGFSPVSHTRIPMTLLSETQNDDGTYTRVYDITTDMRHHPGYFQAGVLSVTYATLFDENQSNYSVSWWGVPYRVQ